MKIFKLLTLLVPMIFSAQDFANIARYHTENETIIQSGNFPKYVFMGDSITEFWKNYNPDFFTKNNYADRGISGQTSSQMLLRFQEDVIRLKPKRVYILAGTNDIAGNQGAVTLEKIFENIQSMAELAKKNHIEVVLCSVLPAFDFQWRKGLQPSGKIIQLNEMIKNYASKNKIPYVDYHSAMKDSRNGLDAKYTEDEVHPNKIGYQKMEEILQPFLK